MSYHHSTANEYIALLLFKFFRIQPYIVEFHVSHHRFLILFRKDYFYPNLHILHYRTQRACFTLEILFLRRVHRSSFLLPSSLDEKRCYSFRSFASCLIWSWLALLRFSSLLSTSLLAFLQKTTVWELTPTSQCMDSKIASKDGELRDNIWRGLDWSW